MKQLVIVLKKILVLSDSHAGLGFMRSCISRVKPDMVIHLGDYYDDGQTMAEEFFHIPFYQVPGNCDRFRCPPWVSEVLVPSVFGVRLFMSHGHRQGVKSGIDRLLADARASGAAAVLYGHTHRADCHREADGLWVLNPGSSGSYGGTAGLIEISEGAIVNARLLDMLDLKQFD